MIIPGIFEKDFETVKTQIQLMEDTASMVQVDIDDGIVDDGLTFLEYEKLNDVDTNIEFDLHLMVAHPLDFLKKPIPNVSKVCTHVEALDEIGQFLFQGKELGYKVGLSIHLDTALEDWLHLVDECDFIQFMTIIPGAQGRRFDKSAISKIKLFKEEFPTKRTQVDGGINENTIIDVLKIGIDDIVIGSKIFKSDDPIKAYLTFKEIHDKEKTSRT